MWMCDRCQEINDDDRAVCTRCSGPKEPPLFPTPPSATPSAPAPAIFSPPGQPVPPAWTPPVAPSAPASPFGAPASPFGPPVDSLSAETPPTVPPASTYYPPAAPYSPIATPDLSDTPGGAAPPIGSFGGAAPYGQSPPASQSPYGGFGVAPTTPSGPDTFMSVALSIGGIGCGLMLLLISGLIGLFHGGFLGRAFFFLAGAGLIGAVVWMWMKRAGKV